jgi:mono/diheme cytochrome c family protein
MTVRIVWAAAIGMLALAANAAEPGKASSAVKRGEYLVGIGGCNDCHSPKLMTPQGPQPDPAKLLSGHPANVQPAPVPPGVLSPQGWVALTDGNFTAWAGPWGVSFAANITPDKATGIGGWTAQQFIQTMRTSKHLGVGRPILPPMPTWSLAALSDADLKAVFAYLQSLKPIANAVPAPLPPAKPN